MKGGDTAKIYMLRNYKMKDEINCFVNFTMANLKYDIVYVYQSHNQPLPTGGSGAKGQALAGVPRSRFPPQLNKSLQLKRQPRLMSARSITFSHGLQMRLALHLHHHTALDVYHCMIPPSKSCCNTYTDNRLADELEERPLWGDQPHLSARG